MCAKLHQRCYFAYEMTEKGFPLPVISLSNHLLILFSGRHVLIKLHFPGNSGRIDIQRCSGLANGSVFFDGAFNCRIFRPFYYAFQ